MDSIDKGLPRVTIHPSHAVCEELKGELFDECKTLLGYDANDTQGKRRDSATLNKALRDAGVEPLGVDSVVAYMSREETRANHYWERLVVHAAGVVLGSILAYHIVGRVTDPMDYILYAMLIFFVGIGGGAVIAWAPGDYYSWKQTPIAGYARPVPEFALSYALAIKKANSETELSVLELATRETVADPFLIAAYGSRRSYIAVWDEPTFENRGISK
jgi:hypothetical protein